MRRQVEPSADAQFVVKILKNQTTNCRSLFPAEGSDGFLGTDFFSNSSKKTRCHKYVRTSCRRVQNLEEQPLPWHVFRRLNHVSAEAPALHIHLN